MKISKIVLCCIMPVLASCGSGDGKTDVYTGISGYRLECVDETGIIYVKFPTGASPLMDIEGNLVPCDYENEN